MCCRAAGQHISIVCIMLFYVTRWYDMSRIVPLAVAAVEHGRVLQDKAALGHGPREPLAAEPTTPGARVTAVTTVTPTGRTSKVAIRSLSEV